MARTLTVIGKAHWSTYLTTGHDIDLSEKVKRDTDQWRHDNGIATVEGVDGEPFEGRDGELVCNYRVTVE